MRSSNKPFAAIAHSRFWHKPAVSLPTDFKSASGTIADVRENHLHMARAYLIFGDIEGKLNLLRVAMRWWAHFPHMYGGAAAQKK
jgi:hypothetical protein